MAQSIPLHTITPRIPVWLWPGYIPLRELTLLDGDGGNGKTRIGWDVAARLTRGWPMPLQAQPTLPPCGAVIVAAEDDEECIVRPTLELMGADLSRIRLVRPEHGLPGDWMDIERAVHEVSAGLIYVDPFSAVVDSRTTESQQRKALQPGIEISRRRNCGLMVSRHLRKTGGVVSAKHRGLGSVGVANIARSGLLVGGDPGAQERWRHTLSISKPFRLSAIHVDSCGLG